MHYIFSCLFALISASYGNDDDVTERRSHSSLISEQAQSLIPEIEQENPRFFWLPPAFTSAIGIGVGIAGLDAYQKYVDGTTGLKSICEKIVGIKCNLYDVKGYPCIADKLGSLGFNTNAYPISWYYEHGAELCQQYHVGTVLLSLGGIILGGSLAYIGGRLSYNYWQQIGEKDAVELAERDMESV